MVIGLRVVNVERGDGINDFICLFQQIRCQRLVSLLTVPRTLTAQRSGKFVKRDEIFSNWCA